MNEQAFDRTREFALAMDASDPLASYRGRFYIPRAEDGRESVYLCGHSLGLQPKKAKDYIGQELADWAKLGVEGHFHAQHPWMPYHRLLTEHTAELLGANPLEVVVMNSLTVNLHLMMISFYRPTAARHRILVERWAFPSDQYAVKSQIAFHGFDPASSLIEVTPRAGESCIREEDVEALIEREGASIALILFGGVNYATGQLFDMTRLTGAGHSKGCAVGFDLAHAAGNVPVQLHDSGADFAVWCSYKYLNGGPGCIAGCFIHERHAGNLDLPRFAGWWGHDEKTRFEMGSEFRAIPGADGWQVSNPNIFSLAALRASMDIFHDAGMNRVRSKSVKLTAYLEFLLSLHASATFEVITPRDAGRRGAQISVRVAKNGKALCSRLAANGIFTDWREPDILRVAPVPLYNSYEDVYSFVEKFSECLR